ncbi:MAG TPA: succinyl-diaminopimelate desuccinylase [Candidatus Eisenbacteria bacterium]|jgi:succinyl-diaminopimelate desuccinylase
MPLTVTHEALADLLATLVDIPSETGEERAISDWVAVRLAERAGGECLRSGASLVWRGPRRGRPLVVLAGHLDTVPANGMGRARVEGGRLHGRGASDMKSGDAVMLSLVETLDPDRLRFDLAAVFYDAEEGPADGNGLGRLLREMPWLGEAGLAILLEPTDLRVELGCVGTLNAEVRARGKSAHSARPWLGVNAIERAAPWLATITRHPVRAVEVQGIEYRETLQVTTLHAGRARNVVPDLLVANLNYRFPPGRSLEEAERGLRALVPADLECAVVDRAPAGEVCADRPLVREFIDRLRLEVAGKQGWTDVARFTAAGVAAFNFGPGVPKQAHQDDEYCPLANLMPAYDRLARFLGAEGA